MNRIQRSRIFPLQLCLTALGTTICFLAVLSAGMFVPLLSGLDHPDQEPAQLTGLVDHILYLHQVFWPFALACLLAVAASSVYVGRRLMAPLIRFARALQTLAECRLPRPVSIREGDFLHREVDLLNRASATVGSWRDALVERHARLRDLVGELRSRAADGPLAELASRIDAEQKQLGEEIQRFGPAD